ncbi:MAG: dihydrofolate reductase [Rikenellaceae bacterium]|nr:dihydrofolate reductase [Rikenellaceae bacterium]
MISIIVAIAKNGVIGCENKLIWHIPEDLKRFKAITYGHPVVMGRKTFESIGRPLSGRTNVIITRNPDYNPENCVTVDSIEKVKELFSDENEEIFIIGGGEIYRQFIPIADKIYVTEVSSDFNGDTFFPEISNEEWKETLNEPGKDGNNIPYDYVFKEYTRKSDHDRRTEVSIDR